MDEDAFTLVVRCGAYGQAVGGDIGVASPNFMDERIQGEDSKSERKKNKEGKEASPFYAFQIHKKRSGAIGCFHAILYFKLITLA